MSTVDEKMYRLIGVFLSVSKIFEQVIVHQPSGFFDSKFPPLPSGFRKRCSCQNAVLSLLRNVR